MALIVYVPRSSTVRLADLRAVLTAHGHNPEAVTVKGGRDVQTVEVDVQVDAAGEAKLRAAFAGVLEAGRNTTLDQLSARVADLEQIVRALTGKGKP